MLDEDDIHQYLLKNSKKKKKHLSIITIFCQAKFKALKIEGIIQFQFPFNNTANSMIRSSS